MPLSCRFYGQKYPEIEDTVMVNVKSIAEMGAYVSLLEYNNIEGMILLSELSRRRIRSVNKLIRVGRTECVVVIRVDKEKGYIDLSKRRVTNKEFLKCEEQFAKAKAINSILRHVADQLDYTEDQQFEDLYEKAVWFFDKKLGKKAGAYDIFKKAIADPSVLDECGLDDSVKDKLIEDIKKKLTPQAVKIRSDVEVSCYSYEGIDAVKKALLEGLQCSTEEMPIKVSLIAPPQYVVTVNTLDREGGLAAVNLALERIKTSIIASQGNYNVLSQPRVVTDLDEKELAKRLELMGLDGAEAEGDGGEEYNEEGMVAPAGLDDMKNNEEASGLSTKTNEHAESDEEK